VGVVGQEADFAPQVAQALLYAVQFGGSVGNLKLVCDNSR